MSAIPFAERLKGKPSIAVRAMVKGLRDAAADPKRRVDMATFGDNEGRVCVGCAATWAILALDPELKPYFFSGKIRKPQSKDIPKFEAALDQFRRGDIDELMRFCQAFVTITIRSHPRLSCLTTFNWNHPGKLEEYEAFAELLEGEGL